MMHIWKVMACFIPLVSIHAAYAGDVPQSEEVCGLRSALRAVYYALPKPESLASMPGYKILDGQPTRLFFTGNPHHPTFGKEKLTQLLDRHFNGKSPVRVDGLADARKDPFTQKPIPQARIPDLHRFLEPEWKADRPKGERLVVLTYVIVEEPRAKKSPEWVKDAADGLEKYAKDALERGARGMFFAEMVQPDHIMAGKAGNKFRRAGLQVFDALASRKVPGIERGPLLQEKLEKHKHFFRDDRHFSDAGKSYIGSLWFETLLRHDGRPIPPWLQNEIDMLVKGGQTP